MAVRRSAPARGMGIGLRFALAIGSGVAVLSILLVVVVLGSARSEIEARVDAQGISSARALAAPGYDGWFVEKDSKVLVRRGARQRLEKLVGSGLLTAYLDSGKQKLVLHKGDFSSGGTGLQFAESKLVIGEWKSGSFSSAARLYQSPLLGKDGAAKGWANVIVAASAIDAGVAGLRTSLLMLCLLAIALSAGLAFAMSSLVTSPLRALVQAVSRINRGNLSYRSTVRSHDELGQLGRAIEGMCDSLREGEEASERLGEVEQDAELVHELQRALLPATLPSVDGFEIAATHTSGTDSGADFYDAVELGDGRLALVVATTAGRGALAALLSAMTRAYLRSYLEEAGDAGAALRRTNRNLAQSMRKGWHVTCQVAVLDPKGGRATVYIAGHRAPFYACRGGEVSVVHGEGLALGLDKGDVFDRRLEDVVVEMPQGTRIVLTTAGTYGIEGKRGKRFGVDRFQDVVRKHAPKNSDAFVNLVLGSLDVFLDGRERQLDSTLVTAKRMT